MNADYLTYRRAATTSALGLGLQIALAVAMVIYSRYSGGDHTAMSAAIALGIGAIVWFALLVLFDQHRRERIESMEAESLASVESAAASAFESVGDEMRVASRRLASIRKWFLPGVSVLVGGLLLGVGYLRLRGASGSALAQFGPDEFTPPPYPGWGIALALAIAFVGFVFARFVSGMAKEPAWRPLRAGAAQAVGGALIGLAMAVVIFVRLAGGPDWPMRALQVAVPIAMLVGGAEIFLNFVLDLYRPRTSGEALRPSFDSRILGFAAAPDKIAESIGEAVNYQFGIDVTSSWFYQLLSKSIAVLVLFAGLIGWGLTGLVVIQPHQRAMILTFGEISRADVEPGLHLKWPWPISSVVTPGHVIAEGAEDRVVHTTTGVQTMQLGTNPPDVGQEPIVWGKQHATLELLHVVQPSGDHMGTPESPDEAQDDVAGALSLVAVEVPVHYVIDDVERYEQLAAPGQQQRLLEAVGRSVVTRFLSTLTVDQVIATERVDLARQMLAELEEAYGALNGGTGAGVRLVFVGAAGVHPPRNVAPQFERVIQARQVEASKMEQAQQAQTRVLTEAAGSVELAQQIVARLDDLEAMRARGADELEVAEAELEVQALLEAAGGQAGVQLLDASAARWAVHMGERGRAALYQGQVASYRAVPALYRAKTYFEALSDAMSDTRVYLTPGDANVKTLIELLDRQSGRDVFDLSSGEGGL